jgi:hypothetical protein
MNIHINAVYIYLDIYIYTLCFVKPLYFIQETKYVGGFEKLDDVH